MIFWTVQKKEIVDKILNGEDYYPNFKKSDSLMSNPNLFPLYQYVLNAFNRINGMDCEGLVFTFMYTEGNTIYDIDDAEEFYALITNRYQCIKSLWKSFQKNDCLILQLEMDVDFNPIFIDINDFQFLMPPVFPMPPYGPYDADRLLANLDNGIVTESIFPSNIMQAHIPFIKKENIVNVYEMFDVE